MPRKPPRPAAGAATAPDPRAADTQPGARTPVAEIQALTDDANFMTSLARGLAVIAAFTDRRRHPTIADLSRRTGIPRASVRRCLYTLEKLGYVASDANTFSLLPKILNLGHAYLGSSSIAVSAQPFLDRVSESVGESCSLAVLERDDILYLARSVTSRILSVSLNVGSRLPAYCTSIGRVLLAHLPEQELNAYVRRTRLVAYTDRTVASAADLRQALEAVRRHDYAIADQEIEIGIRSIAVPVRNRQGTVVAGMNVLTQSFRMNARDMKTRVLPHLQSAALDLGAALSH
jgi:IclR family transcriptional regulator, pca regulon regulatory protein